MKNIRVVRLLVVFISTPLIKLLGKIMNSGWEQREKAALLQSDAKLLHKLTLITHFETFFYLCFSPFDEIKWARGRERGGERGREWEREGGERGRDDGVIILLPTKKIGNDISFSFFASNISSTSYFGWKKMTGFAIKKINLKTLFRLFYPSYMNYFNV